MAERSVSTVLLLEALRTLGISSSWRSERIADIPIAAVTHKRVNEALALSRLEQSSISNAIWYLAWLYIRRDDIRLRAGQHRRLRWRVVSIHIPRSLISPRYIQHEAVVV